MFYYHKVWLILFLSWTGISLSRTALSPLLIPIMDEFGIGFGEAGLLASVYFYTYASFQVPGGYFGDRWQRRSILVIGTLFWGVMALFAGLARGFIDLTALRLGLGAGQGSLFGNDRALLSANTPRVKAGLGQALTLSGAGIGAAASVLLSGYLGSVFGWRIAISVVALPAFLVAFLIWKYINKETKQTVQRASELRNQMSFLQAVKNRDVILLSVTSFCTNYIFWMLGTWSPAIFHDAIGGGLFIASVFGAVFGLAVALGHIFMGTLSDKLSGGIGRKTILVLNYAPLTLGMVLLALSIELFPHPALLLLFIGISAALAAGSWPLMYAALAQIVPSKIHGKVFGFNNFVTTLAAIPSPWLAGILRDISGSFALPVYTGAMMAAIGGLLAYAITPRFRLRVPSPTTTLTGPNVERVPKATSCPKLTDRP